MLLVAMMTSSSSSYIPPPSSFVLGSVSCVLFTRKMLCWTSICLSYDNEAFYCCKDTLALTLAHTQIDGFGMQHAHTHTRKKNIASLQHSGTLGTLPIQRTKRVLVLERFSNFFSFCETWPVCLLPDKLGYFGNQKSRKDLSGTCVKLLFFCNILQNFFV